MVQKFRKKPVVIEAVQFNGYNLGELADFMGQVRVHPLHGNPVINTLEGDMLVASGDYVIKGVAGEFYPCKPDIFAQTYERVVPVMKEPCLSADSAHDMGKEGA